MGLNLSQWQMIITVAAGLVIVLMFILARCLERIDVNLSLIVKHFIPEDEDEDT